MKIVEQIIKYVFVFFNYITNIDWQYSYQKTSFAWAFLLCTVETVPQKYGQTVVNRKQFDVCAQRKIFNNTDRFIKILQLSLYIKRPSLLDLAPMLVKHHIEMTKIWATYWDEGFELYVHTYWVAFFFSDQLIWKNGIKFNLVLPV